MALGKFKTEEIVTKCTKAISNIRAARRKSRIDAADDIIKRKNDPGLTRKIVLDSFDSIEFAQKVNLTDNTYFELVRQSVRGFELEVEADISGIRDLAEASCGNHVWLSDEEYKKITFWQVPWE